MNSAISTFYSKITNKHDLKGVFELAYRPLFLVNFIFSPRDLPKTIDFNLNDIPYLVKDIDLPNVHINSEGEVEVKHFAGAYKNPGDSEAIADSNTFSITFLDTEHSIFEYFFHPWMSENAKIRSKHRNKYPFCRANVEVYLFKNSGVVSENPNPNDVKTTFKLYGVFPNNVNKPNLSYGDNQPSRSVEFSFNILKLFSGIPEHGNQIGLYIF